MEDSANPFSSQLPAQLLIRETSRDVSEEETIGALGRPPQNVPQWHIDYFELKLLKKQPMQGGCSHSPFCLPESRKYISHVKSAPPASGSRRTPLSPETGNSGQESYRNKYYYIFKLLYQAQTLLN